MNPKGFMITDCDETQLLKLIFAAERGDIYLIRKYIKGGTDPNSSDFEGRTALHLAVCGDRLSAVQLLVSEFHARLNPVDVNGNTPLDEALAAGNAPVRDFLLGAGARRGAQIRAECEEK